MPNIIEISELSLPELEIYARLTEGQLKNRAEPEKGLFIAESPNVIDRALDAGYEPVSMLMEHKHVNGSAKDLIARCGPIPIYVSSLEVLTQLTGFQLTRGILCAMRRKQPLSAEDACKNAKRIAVLENIVNPTNVGAIFRSAAALNIDAVLLTQGCCDPLYRRSVRVSMGTVFQVPWAYIGSCVEDWPDYGLKLLQTMGFKTVAMALCDDSCRIDAPILSAQEKLAIVFGTEGEGLSDHTIAICDYTAKIPMSNGVDSLNVAAASAVAFWVLGNNELN